MPFGSRTARFRVAAFQAAVLLCAEFAMPTLRLEADHGELKFRSPHLSMQIFGLGRYACGKTTGRESPTAVEALGVGLGYNRDKAFAQSG